MIFVFTIGSLHWSSASYLLSLPSISASYQQRDGVQQCTRTMGNFKWSLHVNLNKYCFPGLQAVRIGFRTREEEKNVIRPFIINIFNEYQHSIIYKTWDRLSLIHEEGWFPIEIYLHIFFFLFTKPYIYIWEMNTIARK